jgi:DNA-binding response OmpR family regulator
VQPHEVAEYKELGAIDVIPKPFDPMNLSANIQEIWSNKGGG